MKLFKRITLILTLLLSSVNLNAQVAYPRATYYYCGDKGMGWTVAAGEKLTPQKAKQVRYIAISRDLERKGFKLGKYIKVECEEYPFLNGIWRIMDRMAVRVHNGIDFLLQNRHEQKAMKMPRKVKISLVNK